MTLAVWIHAQIGVHGVLRMRKWYPKVQFLIIIIFVLMPIIGISGYFRAGFQIEELILKNNYSNLQIPTNQQLNIIKLIFSRY